MIDLKARRIRRGEAYLTVYRFKDDNSMRKPWYWYTMYIPNPGISVVLERLDARRFLEL